MQTEGRMRRLKMADLFCGAGGTSTGAEKALATLGLEMDLLCVNHWDTAIETHRLNHPKARHYCQDLNTVRPVEAVPGGKLDLLTASPTCTFHSRARGGKPVSDQQRMDPWHVVTWLTELRVKRMLLENVPEFRDWGPVDTRTGKPIKERKGEYFRAWVAAMQALGMRVEHGIVNCADHGDATTRKRWFMIGRSDGKALEWPQPSYAKDPALVSVLVKRWRPAREIIDWEIKGRSIFARPKPLSANTLARIWAGAIKFGWAEPYLVLLRNHMTAQGLDVPLPTITAGGTHIALAQPIVISTRQHTGGPAPRSANDPIPTVTATDSRIAFAQPIILPQSNHAIARSIDDPVPAVVTIARVGLIQPFVLSRQGGGAPRSVDYPTPGQTTKHSHILVEPSAPLISPYYGTGSGETCSDVESPLPTVTTKARFGMVVPITHSQGNNVARDIDNPLPTITTAKGGEFAFITAQHGEREGQAPRVHSVGDPTPTVCARGHIDLVHAQGFDILFRMLEPHELAAAMSFSDTERRYVFAGNKTEQIKQIGNAVPVRTATALITALCRDAARKAKIVKLRKRVAA